jgi:hypothetical protein
MIETSRLKIIATTVLIYINDVRCSQYEALQMARELIDLRKLAEDMAKGIEDYPQRFANTEIALSAYRHDYPKIEQEEV